MSEQNDNSPIRPSWLDSPETDLHVTAQPTETKDETVPAETKNTTIQTASDAETGPVPDAADVKKKNKPILIVVIVLAVLLLLFCCCGVVSAAISGSLFFLSKNDSHATVTAIAPNSSAWDVTSENASQTNSDSYLETESVYSSDSAATSENGSASEQDEALAGMTDSEKFDYYVYNCLGDYLFSDLTTTHFLLSDTDSFSEYWGERTYPLSLGEYSVETLTEAYEEEIALYDSISKLDYDSLDENQQMIYDELAYYANIDITYGNMVYYNEPLSSINGIHVSLPALLAEYQFHSEEEVTEYLIMLTTVPDYFEQVAEFEQAKSDVGLFMSDDMADNVIDACGDVTGVDVSDNYMCTTFRDRLSGLGLSDRQIDNYCEANEEAVRTYVYAAYDALAENIEALKGTGTNDGGLCGLPNGKDYYASIVATNVGTSESIEQLREETIDQINSDLTHMQRYYTEDTLEELEDYSFGLTDPEEILEDLQTKMSSAFPELDSVNYEINAVPDELADISSPAYYIIPPIDTDTTEENNIYINYAESDAETTLYYTLAHEGYPGHLYQTNYFKSLCDDPFRNSIRCSGFTEGYATYAEMYAYLWTDGFSDDLGYLLMYNHSATLGMYALMDIYINYDGYSRTDIAEFIAGNFGVSDDDLNEVTESIYELIVGEPGNYLNYYIGYMEILRLSEDYFNRNPYATALDFNTELLSYGAAPFDVIRARMIDE